MANVKLVRFKNIYVTEDNIPKLSEISSSKNMNASHTFNFLIENYYSQRMGKLNDRREQQ